MTKFSNILNVVMILLLLLILVALYRTNTAVVSLKEPTVKPSVSEAFNRQSRLSFSVQSLFLEYETAVSDYLSDSSVENRQAVLNSSQALEKTLQQVSDVFGLNVKRWGNLFLIWKERFETLLYHYPEKLRSNQVGKSEWHLGILEYYLLIDAEIKKSLSEANETFLSELLYSRVKPQEPSKALRKEVMTFYETKVKPQMSQAIQEFQAPKQSIRDCFPKELEADPESPEAVARWIASLQYQSRVCPIMVRSKPRELCNKLKHISVLGNKDPKQLKALQTRRILCEIVETRLQAERADARRRFSHLSYSEYYKNFVQPLVPNMKMMLSENIQKGRLFAPNCRLNDLPVVDFRDPKIDAITAAYEQIIPVECAHHNLTKATRFARLLTVTEILQNYSSAE